MKYAAMALSALIFTGVGYGAAFGPSAAEKKAQNAAYDALEQSCNTALKKEGISKSCCLVAIQSVVVGLAIGLANDGLDLDDAGFDNAVMSWLVGAEAKSCGAQGQVLELTPIFSEILNEHLSPKLFTSEARSVLSQIEVLRNLYMRLKR